MSNGKKIAALFAVFGLAIAALAVVAITPIDRDVAIVGEFHAPALHKLQNIESRLMVAVGDSFAYVVSGDEIEKVEFIAWIRSFEDQIDELNNLVAPGGFGDPEQSLLRKIRDEKATLAANAQAMFDDYESTGVVSPRSFSAYERSIDEIEHDFAALLDLKRKDMDLAHKQALDSLKTARFLFFLLGLVAVLTSIVFGLALSRYVDSNELKLKESQKRYQEIFDEAPGCFWVEDWSEIKLMVDRLADSGIEDWRRHFADRDRAIEAYNLARDQEFSKGNFELFGYQSREDLLKSSSGESATASELGAFVEMLVGFIEGRYRGAIQSVDTRADGSEVTVVTRYVVPEGRRTQWSRMIYLIDDITDRTCAEEQLRQAQKMETVGQLSGGIAHDFNNLLAVIMGSLEMIREKTAANESLRMLVDGALNAADHGATLTQRLLAFSRKQPLAPRYVDANDVVKQSIYLMRRAIDETVTFNVNLTDESAPVFIDTGQLETALLNLAVNARDALARNGEITIETGIRRIESSDTGFSPGTNPGDYVALSVSDNGSGMPTEVLTRAFEPFFSTKDVGKGSGLGMSMVYGFVKQSGGDLDIQSEVGAGTTVTIYLPLADGVQAVKQTRPESPPKSAGAERCILVVEDEKMVRDLIVRSLTDMGHTVHQASDGEAALSIAAETSSIDLLLTDVMLPGGMDGVELADELRRRIPHLPVLFSSGYSTSSLTSQGRIDGEVDVLLKPFKLDDLADRIDNLLKSA